jgi:methionyl-tRNA formyltransferase
MKDLRSVLLMESASANQVGQLAKAAGIQLNAKSVSNLADLACAFEDPPDLLLCFGTSVIVPTPFLESPGLLALNVHAASPDYPGRDPHHFAVYDGVVQYGATMHFMTSKVDDGQIVDVELFDILEEVTPVRLLELANKSAWVLIERFFSKLAAGQVPCPVQGASWGNRKTTRKMFLELCRLDPSMSEAEFFRRMRAAAMPGFNNLYIELHGHRFRIESKI